MDDVVDLIYSASLCGTGSGSIPTFDQNNIITYVSTNTALIQNTDVITAINTHPQFVIDEKEIFILQHFYTDTSTVQIVVIVDYYLIRPGKGTYGAGGTALVADNLFFLRGGPINQQPTLPGTTSPPRVLNLFADSVVGATINTPHDILNGQTVSIVIADTQDTYFAVFETANDLQQDWILYRFIGDAGDYGNSAGPVDTAVLGDFLLIETVSNNDSQPPSNGQIKWREIGVPAVIDPGNASLDSISDVVNNSFRGLINAEANEIVMFVTDRLEATVSPKKFNLVNEKWVWNQGEQTSINVGSVDTDFYKIEVAGATLVDGSGSTNNPAVFYVEWPSVADTTAAAAAVNSLTGGDRVVLNDNFVLVKISVDDGSNTYKVWEFTGATTGDGTYGVAGLTAVAGDFNSTPLVDSTSPATIIKAADVFFDDNTALLSADNVQTAIEALKVLIDAVSISAGSPLLEITTNLPSVDHTKDAYRAARLGLGSTILPAEMLDLVTTEALAKGGIKSKYTYTSGGITRLQSGGQNVYSELSAATGSVEGFNHEHFADTTSYVDNLRSYSRGGDYTGDGDTKSLTAGIGIISATKDRYGRLHAQRHTTNNDKDWLIALQALNEDTDSSSIQVATKGSGTGFTSEGLVTLTAANSEADSVLLSISPHVFQSDALTILTGYGAGTFIQGYTHTDTVGKTGTTATTIGASAFYIGVDANGVLLDVPTSTVNSGLEAIDEGNGIGWRLVGRNPANFGNIGLDSTDVHDGSSGTHGATGDYCFVGGKDNVVSGNRSVAFGSANNITGSFSSAIGFNMTITGDYSAGFGHSVTAGPGDNCFAQGSDSIASGGASACFGDDSVASGNQAFAMGKLNTAAGLSSFASGYWSTASSFGEFNAGIYATTYSPGGPTSIVSTDRLFNIGNGTTNGARSNAFTIYKDGDIDISSGNLFIAETTAANADKTAFGQIWIKDDAPNTIWFTDDTGVDYQLGGVGGSEFADNLFRIQDNGDPTKELAFEVSAITTATTRTLTIPDNDTDLANLSQGSQTVRGTWEDATVGEADTGTDTTRVMSVDTFAGSDFGTKEMSVNVYNVAVDVDTTTGLASITIPASLDGYLVVEIIASVHTLGTSSGAETIDVNVERRRAGSSVDILSTAITLAKTEYFIADGIIDAANDDMATGDTLIPIVTNNLDTTDATGLSVTIEFRKP